jgi:hypothetical protein
MKKKFRNYESRLIKALAKDEALMIDKADVAVMRIEMEICCEDGCAKEGTHLVIVDVRRAAVYLRAEGKYCKKHAKARAKLIQEALPR